MLCLPWKKRRTPYNRQLPYSIAGPLGIHGRWDFMKRLSDTELCVHSLSSLLEYQSSTCQKTAWYSSWYKTRIHTECGGPQGNSYYAMRAMRIHTECGGPQGNSYYAMRAMRIHPECGGPQETADPNFWQLPTFPHPPTNNFSVHTCEKGYDKLSTFQEKSPEMVQNDFLHSHLFVKLSVSSFFCIGGLHAVFQDFFIQNLDSTKTSSLQARIQDFG